MDKAKRIAFFNTAKTWGGGEKWHFEMAQACADAGMAVSCICMPGSAFEEKLSQTDIPNKSFKVGNLSFLNPVRLWQLYRYFKQEQFSYIIMNLPSDIKAAGLAAKWAGIPHVIYRRGSAIPIKNRASNRYIFSKVLTGIIANSEATKKTINYHTHLFPEEKIQVIYNGLHLPEKQAHCYDTSKATLRIGHLGRMVPQKGHEYLLTLAQELKTRGHRFSLVLGGDGKLEDEIRSQVKERNLNDVIHFHGFVDDVHPFMQSMDLFVLTSKWEGFGFVLAEAMAAGLPLVAFDISSNPELLLNEQNGFLVTPFDISAFADKVEHLLQDSALRKKYGQHGQDFVYQTFAFDASFKHFTNYLKSLQ